MLAQINIVEAKMNCPHCGKAVALIKQASKPEYDSDDNGRSFNPPTGDVGELLDRIDDDTLSGAAIDFVSTTRERYEQYGDRIKLSEKQLAWLERLASS